jgi:hypothetical protein
MYHLQRVLFLLKGLVRLSAVQTLGDECVFVTTLIRWMDAWMGGLNYAGRGAPQVLASWVIFGNFRILFAGAS